MARVKNAHAFAFVTKDNLPLAIHCSVPEKFWLAFLKASDRLDLAQDPRFKTRDLRRQNYEELEKTLAPTFATRSREDWLHQLESYDVPVSPVYNMAEVLDDPQVRHLELVDTVEHPQAGKLKFIGGPVGYQGLAKSASRPPPLLGEHSGDILAELGYDQSTIDKLIARNIIKVSEVKD
jgi:crotonobetainyl-CoA:carnitine CoA-transferase CaiB-like acyl-CoA transferase